MSTTPKVEWFKPYDFRISVTVGNVTCTITDKDAEAIAAFANAKLQRAIQPIEKPKCEKHEPGEALTILTSYPAKQLITCRHCGVKLVAEWKAEGE